MKEKMNLWQKATITKVLKVEFTKEEMQEALDAMDGNKLELILSCGVNGVFLMKVKDRDVEKKVLK